MRQVRGLWAALIALTVLTMTPDPSLAQGGPSPVPADLQVPAGRLIIVTGQGTVEATPDRATVTLGIVVLRLTAQDAQDRASGVMEQIARQVSALGIPRERIQTAAVGLFPQRKPDNNQITGYEAVNRISITMDDLSLPGRVIDAGVAAGATSVDSLMFGLRDPSVYRSRALRLAVQSAQASATVIAAQAGLGPLHLVRIEEVGEIVQPRMIAAPLAAATPISPGLLPLSVEVRALYTF
jgi:uncharacterized protein